jgi:carboxymethylenebutenolidase
MISDIVSQMIEFKSNEHTTPGFLSGPASPGRYPGLVAIQEWWGLVPHIKDVAERFAHQGFITLAPDLYHGQAASEPDEARKLAMELDRERAVGEIQAAMRYLQGLEGIWPKKIGVIGWCMGGGLVVATMAASREVGAGVAFYGGARNVELVPEIRAPLLGLFGEEDHGIPVDVVHTFEQELEERQVPHEIHIYSGAGHAFFNDSRPQIYDAVAAQDAWERTLAWFRNYLR